MITPHSGLDAFRNAVYSLTSGSKQARRLAWRFFLRDTRADHRQSLLGYVWLVFPPLANALTWVFLNNQRVIHIDSGSVAYPLFVLSGVILWTAFNGALMSMLNIVGAARGFISKVNFPHESLVYSAFLKSSLDATLSSLVLLPAFLLFKPPFDASMPLFLGALFSCLLLGWTLGLIMVPIATLYSDVGRAIQVVLRFGFFLAPVIFKLPETGFARKLMLLNPATPLVVTGRDWLTGSSEAMPVAFTIVLFSCVPLLAIGLLFYKVALPHLIERLSA